jgi:alkylation response protein AidB-like acyl-CoA dehydrogenase
MGYFNEEHNLFRESLRGFLNREVSPNIEAWEKDGKIPRSIWKKMGDMGFLGLSLPQKYGGSELDFFF